MTDILKDFENGAILTAPEIERMIKCNIIAISPYNDKQLNPNSYNLKLYNVLKVYNEAVLDARRANQCSDLVIPPEGLILKPNHLYLGRTVEHTRTMFPFVPMLEGRSSLGRLGLSIHITAGFGDTGYCGTWTLEITCVQPLRIYPFLEVAQIFYIKTCGEEPPPYTGKYQNATDTEPSKLYEELK